MHLVPASKEVTSQLGRKFVRLRTLFFELAKAVHTQLQYQQYQAEIELKSLILAQIERWRHALHMQVERRQGATPGEWRTGE